jgi:hypothetical protein
MFTIFTRAALGVACALALAACGGGGGNDSDTPVAAAPAPTPSAGGARWTPSAADTWQWQLKGSIDTSIAATVYDIDLFDAPQATIDALKARGRRVVCYFSAGSSENWRSDFARFEVADMGNPLDNWPGERWLDTRSVNVRAIMQSRLDLAVSKGCDGVEPDNMDAYQNGPGFALSADAQLDYNRFIAREARARGLAVGLKNDVDQLAALEPEFDFAVNEQCHQYTECDGYGVFTSKGKPVFNAEYDARWVNDATARNALCAASRTAGLRTLVLPVELGGSFRYGCD